MAAGIDTVKFCPSLPEGCHPPSGPIRPDPAYGFPELGSGAMPNFPPIDLPIVPPPPGPDICCIEIEDGATESFDCYEEGDAVPSSMTAGCGWGSSWNARVNYFGMQAFESWDVVRYGWTGAPSIAQNA